MITSKFVIPAIGAVAMSAALGLFMIKLIHVDFEAEQEYEPIAMVAKVKPPEKPRSLTTTKPVRKANIEVPPRTDPIEVEQVGLPKGPVQTEPLKKVEFPIMDPDLTPTDTAIPDKDAQPIIRVVAKVPERALREGRSGHCYMRFDVNTRGEPFKVEAYRCSHKMFEKNSIQATKGFKYLPKIKGGAPVNMTGVETKITYKVLDEKGRLLPS